MTRYTIIFNVAVLILETCNAATISTDTHHNFTSCGSLHH